MNRASTGSDVSVLVRRGGLSDDSLGVTCDDRDAENIAFVAEMVNLSAMLTA
jgi:hypothetical protein